MKTVILQNGDSDIRLLKRQKDQCESGYATDDSTRTGTHSSWRIWRTDAKFDVYSLLHFSCKTEQKSNIFQFFRFALRAHVRLCDVIFYDKIVFDNFRARILARVRLGVLLNGRCQPSAVFHFKDR